MRPKHHNQSLIKSHSVYKCSTRSYITFTRWVQRSASLLSSQLLSHHHKFPPSLLVHPRPAINPLISAVNTWRAGALYPEPFPTLCYKYSSLQPLRLCSVSFLWWWLHQKTFGIQEGSQIYIQIEETRVEEEDLDLVNKCQSGKLDYRFWTCVVFIQSGPHVCVLINVSGVSHRHSWS